MVYVALLRGINVGGNSKIAMSELKVLFESLGYTRVSTYINSGNIVFEADELTASEIVAKIESAIVTRFGLPVRVIIRDVATMIALVQTIPDSWTNDTTQKTDVLFLWDEIDSPAIIDQISHKPYLEELRYVHGALLWNIGRKNITKSALLRIVGTPIYKQMTVRNVNTVRKLATIMGALNDSY